jgi:gamma-glutamylputrescine oxidase
MRNLSLPLSLWRETASPAADVEELDSSVSADVAIIGAGYTGLSAALRAIERNLHPVIIEASEVGFGASGRNGGVVSTKFRVSLSDMAKRHGTEIARRMSRLGHEAMDCVEHYVESCGIATAGFAKTGNLRCAHNALALERLVEEAKTARNTFGDDGLTIFDRHETAAETGSTDFVGGVLNSHAGVIHPLNYVRGLGSAVRNRGGRIFERSPVLSVKREGSGVELIAPRGMVKAKRLIIATNGYSDVTPATSAARTAVIPFRSAMIATEPLPNEAFDTLVPRGRSYSETRRMMRWFRRIDDRLLFGGRGAFGKTDSQAAFNALELAMKRIFPRLATTTITHRWSGLVAMTLDSLPQIGRLDPQTAYSVGYNGTGIAMASLLGRHALDLVLGEEPDLALMRRKEPQAIPFYFLREPAVRAVAGWYQLLDRLGR